MPKIIPDFIYIPYPVFLDTELSSTDKFVYGAVYFFSNTTVGKRCTASNETLGDLIQTTSQTVTNSLKKLEERRHIHRLFSDEASRRRQEIIPLVVVTKLTKKQAKKESFSDTPQSVLDTPQSLTEINSDTPQSLSGYTPEFNPEKTRKKQENGLNEPSLGENLTKRDKPQSLQSNKKREVKRENVIQTVSTSTKIVATQKVGAAPAGESVPAPGAGIGEQVSECVSYMGEVPQHPSWGKYRWDIYRDGWVRLFNPATGTEIDPVTMTIIYPPPEWKKMGSDELLHLEAPQMRWLVRETNCDVYIIEDEAVKAVAWCDTKGQKKRDGLKFLKKWLLKAREWNRLPYLRGANNELAPIGERNRPHGTSLVISMQGGKRVEWAMLREDYEQKVQAKYQWDTLIAIANDPCV